MEATSSQLQAISGTEIEETGVAKQIRRAGQKETGKRVYSVAENMHGAPNA